MIVTIRKEPLATNLACSRTSASGCNAKAQWVDDYGLESPSLPQSIHPVELPQIEGDE